MPKTEKALLKNIHGKKYHEMRILQNVSQQFLAIRFSRKR